MTATTLTIDREHLTEHNAWILKLNGTVNAHTFERLEADVGESFKNNHFRLIIDLSAVEYVSSAGMGVLMHAMAEARRNGGNLVLMNAASNVREVFYALHWTEVFNLVDGIDAALELLG